MPETNIESTNEAKAIVKYLRISPRKVRLVINAIRRKPVTQAFPTLTALNKKAARLVEKALKSAVANAKVLGLEESKLVVWDTKADGGPVMKRAMARAMGRADEMLKRSTHLTIILRQGEKDFGSASSATQEKEKSGKGREKPKKVKAAGQRKAKAAAAGA